MSDMTGALVDAIHEADDEEALRLEALGVMQTDNGFQPGDPEDQPEQA